MRFVEDPSIAAAARAEHAEMMAAILVRYEAGEDYFVAREAVMAEHGPRIAKDMGKEAAKRALAAVCSHSPRDLPRDSRLRHAAAEHDKWLEHADRWFGPGHHWTRRQRATIATLGVSHWAAHPLGGIAWLAGTTALAAGAWWAGFFSPAGVALASVAALLTIDAVMNNAKPAGRDLAGAELDAWRAERAAEEDAAAAADYDAELDRQAAEANDQAKWKGARRAIREVVRQADKKADGEARAALPEPPPLDDFGKAFITPRGAR